MGLETVLNEILARSSEQEQAILRQAESERQRLLDAAEGEADEIRARILQETRSRVDALRREQQSAAEFEARRRLLAAQRGLAEDFRKRVLATLADLPAKDLDRVHTTLAKRAQAELPQGRIHARKEHLAALVKATGYDKGDAIECAGGFRVESPDGSTILDYRFETLFEAVWPQILHETRTLFEG
jgi:vacuolar-type H+-ATPase subunit E/Vma4